MNHLRLIVAVFFVSFNVYSAVHLMDKPFPQQEKKLKRYEIKSAIVIYETHINGGLLGSTVTGSGFEKLYFKDWGNLELKEAQTNQTTKTNIFGIKKSETTETHTMNKLDNGKSYTVDFDREIITLNRDMAMEMTKTFADGDVHKTGREMLEGMGGKIVGQEAVLGYTCDVWDVMGGKQWIYKGLPLKIEVSMMGITTTTVATSAQFNVDVSDQYFVLPNFKVQEMEGYRNDKEYASDKAEMKKNAQKMKNMSYSEYKAMLIKDDPEAAQMSEEEMKQSYQMFQMMMKKMSK